MGPEHSHWIAARQQLRESDCNRKLAYLMNAYGVRDPKLAVLCVFAAQYLTVLGKCGMTSWQIVQAKRAPVAAPPPPSPAA